MKARRIPASIVLISAILFAPAAFAKDWEDTEAYKAVAIGVDAVLVRPLATLRVAVGAALMLPASLFTAPSGKESVMDSYEILVEEPVQYAFHREMGEF